MRLRLAPKYEKLLGRAARQLGVPSVQLAQNIIIMYIEELLAHAANAASTDRNASTSDNTEGATELPDSGVDQGGDHPGTAGGGEGVPDLHPRMAGEGAVAGVEIT